MTNRHQMTKVETEAYFKLSQDGPCFICEIVRGNPAYPHHIIYEDAAAIVFLSKHQIVYGYTLVCPKAHREAVTSDFTLDEYVAMQQVIWRVGEAVQQTVPTERLYILSLGSQQGNRHVHWHIAALPPGVPYAEQQLEALLLKRGLLELSEAELADLAQRIAAAMSLVSRL